MSHHHTARANRIGLAIVGLVLLLAGAAALARGLGLRVLGPRHDQVVSQQVAAYAAGHPWFWPALAVLALVVELLALRWFLLQGRVDTIRYLSLEPDPGRGATHLSARAAASALEDDVEETMRGTRPTRGEGARGQRVRATLGGAPTEPRLSLAVVLPDEADPAAARQGVHRAVTRLRQSLETEHLPTVVRMHTIRTHF
ncbi:alkaline shock response membrane anchor protein AmaP [Sphaerisporangium sp. NPDC088356]|uniref:alkaline shock response membrane anchor protein AmaP n=1 Tax=Sphaerisporangium sp. NPDC088356 TaxID=3154871 RepID=UPI003412A6CA